MQQEQWRRHYHLEPLPHTTYNHYHKVFKGIWARHARYLLDSADGEADLTDRLVALRSALSANAKAIWTRDRDPRTNYTGTAWQGPYVEPDEGEDGKCIAQVSSSACLVADIR